MRCAALVAACMLALVAPRALAHISINATGAVAHAGALELPDGARLSAGALAARPLPDAYMLGAAWLRPRLVPGQTRLKAGVLYDLAALRTSALARGDIELARTARGMHAWLTGLPVTGRRTPATLAPRVAEATPAEDQRLAPGDTLYYPVRPTSVRVVGALASPCTLPFTPLASVRHYLARCAPARVADRDWAWVVEPDGSIARRGVALWNLSAAAPLAPGAVIYRPIRARPVDRIDPDMDREIALFLATQPVGLDGGAP